MNLPLSSSDWSSMPAASVTMLDVLSVILAVPSAIKLCVSLMLLVFCHKFKTSETWLNVTWVVGSWSDVGA
jgi:hypothetical protein